MENYMKNLLSALVCLVTLSSVANADFARIEAGAGAWMQTPDTLMKYQDSTGVADGIDESTGSEETDGYVWLLIKHPIPIVPNLRLEYVSLTSSGISSGKFLDFVSSGDAPSTLDMTQFDIIPYYNILDNTSWITLDVGLDIKVIEATYETTAKDPLVGLIEQPYSETSSTIVPLLYVRTRFEIPTTDIGLEADVKYITDGGDSTVSDIRIKVDYTLSFIPVIQPGIELGYRIFKMETVNDDDLEIDLDYSGVYVGAMIRF